VAASLLPAQCALAAAPLRFCADPNNLPYSNRAQQGFENRLAGMVGRQLHRPIEYYWSRNRGRGFVRETLDAGACDVLLGIPAKFTGVATTAPYMRSSYVFVRRAGSPAMRSLDDPALRRLRIGVQALDEDYAPPGRALGRRGLVMNLVPFASVGSGSGEIVRAVATGKVDLAIVWGPLAGYYASKQRIRLALDPVEPEFDPPGLPFVYEISMGVRKGDMQLRDQLNAALQRARPEIQRVLNAYGVPQRDARSTAQGMN
jgi:mxaJ protein